MEDVASKVSRRKFVSVGSAIAVTAALGVAGAQDDPGHPASQGVPRSADHSLPNEQDPGPRNPFLEAENPSSVWAEETDNGAVHPSNILFRSRARELKAEVGLDR